MQLSKAPGWDWRTYPAVRRHPETGVEEATWPSLFPLEWVRRERQEYQSTGQAAVWDREFMCEAVSVGEQIFRAEDIRVEPRVRVVSGVRASRSSSALDSFGIVGVSFPCRLYQPATPEATFGGTPAGPQVALSTAAKRKGQVSSQ
jgi:hypothetical protein